MVNFGVSYLPADERSAQPGFLHVRRIRPVFAMLVVSGSYCRCRLIRDESIRCIKSGEYHLQNTKSVRRQDSDIQKVVAWNQKEAIRSMSRMCLQ